MGDFLVNAIVDKGRHDIQAFMKRRGYDCETRHHSTLFETVFTKNEKAFSIDGWHGIHSARKSIFTLYDRQKPAQSSTVVESRCNSIDMSLTAGEQKQLIHDMLNYLRMNA